MAAFVPEHAPAVVLAFLMTGLLGGAGVMLFMGLLLAGRPRAALRVVAGLVTVGVLYAAGLVSAAVTSADRSLDVGENKYFCEIDCHFAVALVGASVVEAVGSGPERVVASGRFHVVTVRAWFDERTISSRRARDVPLYGPRRRVRVVDAAGRWWEPSVPGQRAVGAGIDALDRPLVPGASYEAVYVFDLPVDVRQPRLLVEDRSVVSKFLIGHENSVFHGKVLFDLESAAGGSPRVRLPG